MKSRSKLLLLSALIIILAAVSYSVLRISKKTRLDNAIAFYSGSKSCRPCHERFYELWAPSHHGTAMQEVSADFIENNIKSFASGIAVGNSYFNVENRNDSLLFTQVQEDGSKEEYIAIHTLGGKYIFYFLTEFERGRLHVLPLAYDCGTDSWYNNPESGVRHFETIDDEPLDWKNHLYTFNTSCYNCHVSQLESNFSLEDLSYTTKWNEPGINCETCHGPSSEHIRVCVEAGEDKVPEDLKIIITSTFSKEQHDASCGSCHAKSSIVAPAYQPGERFYDYFDLTTLENHDFYADGRDLGENYTMTSWAQNTCKESADIHCVTCHTSSGRYRFAGENTNQACAPCHNDKINNVSLHSFHKEDSEGSKCVACHMPMTTFARMDRSDHSFRPPMPEATITFGSPNACNICHSDKSPEWSNSEIQKTHRKEYQSETIRIGKLLRKARANDWSDLSDIAEGLEQGSFNEVYSSSFLRLLENCSDTLKWRGIMARTYDESPLIRSAAAHALSSNGGTMALGRLSELASDDYRLVRMNAAYALSAYSSVFPAMMQDTIISFALEEYLSSLSSRNDDWASFYNLGNFYSNYGDYQSAITAYNNSIRVYPEAIMPMINAGFLYSLSGEYTEAERMFDLALGIEENNEAALLNLALLYGETSRNEEAVACFKRLMDVSDKNATAAYNLSILLSQTDPDESLRLMKLAYLWNPNPRYGYSCAFYLSSAGEKQEAIDILEKIILEQPDYLDAYHLLANIFIEEDRDNNARELLNRALLNKNFDDQQKQSLITLLKSIA